MHGTRRLLTARGATVLLTLLATTATTATIAPAQAASARIAPTGSGRASAFLIRSVATRACLTLDPYGQTVQLTSDCSARDAQQLWTAWPPPAGLAVMSRLDGACLTDVAGTRLVLGATCVRGDRYQQWNYQPDDTVANAATGQCLTADAFDELTAATCLTGDASQRWRAQLA
jgi:hypothetical protein